MAIVIKLIVHKHNNLGSFKTKSLLIFRKDTQLETQYLLSPGFPCVPEPSTIISFH